MTAAPIDPRPSTWSTAELSDIRQSLVETIDRLQTEVAVVSGHLSDVVVEAGSTGGLDEIDVASTHIEVLHDSAQAENTAIIVEQTRRVLDRLDRGLYGTCEGCGDDIGRLRLEAFPRASLCITCA